MQKFKMHTDFAKVDTTVLLEKTLSVMHMDLKAHFKFGPFYMKHDYNNKNLFFLLKVTTKAN